MKTKHDIFLSDARNMSGVADNSIDLIVTSPPYPMIEMWDGLFANNNSDIRNALDAENGNLAFELMHIELDKVWQEVARIVKPNGFVCINIGDATRTIGKYFQLYSNHSRITNAFVQLSFQPLPIALWKKATNAPNKFMGSGMLPAGAYITLEHEYILVFRNGGKREFKSQQQKTQRNQSAFFWEERNSWFSDTWTFKGVRQATNDNTVRERNAAYPFDLPYRLINMYSVVGDTVLDPFLGTGTTTISAMASQRNSIGFEIDANFLPIIDGAVKNAKLLANKTIDQRISEHISFVHNYEENKKELKHRNSYFGFPVMTKQEAFLELHHISSISHKGDSQYTVRYKPIHIDEHHKNTDTYSLINHTDSDIQVKLF